MNEPLVSVVIVTWNRKDDLKEAVRSVHNQTYRSIEMIVVDNHSTDGSIEMIQKELPEVKLIIMPGSSYGACETLNIGMVNATGEFIVVMDDDVILPKDCIEKFLNKFEKEPENTGVIVPKVIGKDFFWSPNDKDQEMYCGNFIGCGVAIKKEVLGKAGLFDKTFFIYVNEKDLSARILNAGYKILYYPDSTTNHKEDFKPKTSDKWFFYVTRNMLWYYWKNTPLKDAIINSGKHVLFSFITALIQKRIKTFFKAIISAATGFPRCIKKRNVCKSKQYDFKKYKSIGLESSTQ